jgi:O-antigen/teichoic acid export membrane protein
VQSSIIQVSDVALRSCILIVLALYGASAETLSLSYIVGAVFSAFIAMFLFTKIKYKPTRPAYLKEYIVFARPIAVGLLLITAVSFIDKIMVASFWSTTELGYYTAAMGVAYAATAIGVTLNYVLLPGFSEMFSKNERSSIEELLWRSEKYLSILFIPAVIFVMVFGDDLAVVLFGSGFAPAGQIISVLSLYIYLCILHGVLTQVLYSTNNSKLYRNATIVYAVTTLIMLIVLVPENIGGVELAGLGAVGAAASITVGYFIFTVLISHYVKLSAGFKLHKGLVRQLLAGIVVFAAAYIINWEASLGLLLLLLVLLVCYTIFIVMLFLLKELTKSDIVIVKNAIRSKKTDEE